MGSLIFFLLDPYLPSYISNYKKGHQTGYDTAKKFVEQSTVGKMFSTTDDIRAISGVVLSKEEDRITLHSSSLNPFEDPRLTNRTIFINSSTTIVRLEPKDPREFQSEIYSFFSSPSSNRIQPEPYTKVAGTIADIEVGTPISVTATENIKTSQSFLAQEIDIQSRSKTNLDFTAGTSSVENKFK